ncbi:hypothetical protein AAFC00_000756 [Neodothiora populina]|uniref:FAD dependent oxidoreductase domain-containing protein n=1 Tax=Neodothiora populina TaxID=2781224 RepID=A0ABR3PM15_9PEZI
MESITVDNLKHLATSDPGLPVRFPTHAGWQAEPSRLAEVQSQTLPGLVDVVIVGSGITGASVAKTLLEGSASAQVAMLEARTLCSGATGRNGGQIATYGTALYSSAKSLIGIEAATRFVDFTLKNVEALAALMEEYVPVDAEYRKVDRVRTFSDDVYFQEVKRSVAEYEKDNPQSIHKGMYTFKTSDELLKEHGIHGAVGGMVFPAAACWPYRFISKLYQSLLEKYRTRFSIETNTPATAITYEAHGDPSHPYLVATPRGTTRATHVVHATNGYSGHLVPELRGRVIPYRGTMTVQDLSSAVPNHGYAKTWSIHHKPKVDRDFEAIATGAFYLQQNAHTGHFWFVGECKKASMTVTADDSFTDGIAVDYLRAKLARFFGLEPSLAHKLVAAWTGIMGFTADGFPMVGPLPNSVTSRQGSGEWIAAGFNGVGMSLCLLSGEAVANMILGHAVDTDFPGEVFALSQGRMQKRLTTDETLKNLSFFVDLPSKSRTSRL